MTGTPIVGSVMERRRAAIAWCAAFVSGATLWIIVGLLVKKWLNG